MRLLHPVHSSPGVCLQPPLASPDPLLSQEVSVRSSLLPFPSGLTQEAGIVLFHHFPSARTFASFCFPPESSLVTLDPLPRASLVFQIRSGTALTSPHYQMKKSRLVPSPSSCFSPQGHSLLCFLDPGVRTLPCPLAYKSPQR